EKRSIARGEVPCQGGGPTTRPRTTPSVPTSRGEELTREVAANIKGACLEVNLPTSSLALADDDWGAFLVDRVDAKLDASLKRHFSRGVVSFGGLGAGGVLDDPPLLEFWCAEAFLSCEYIKKDKLALLKRWLKEMAPTATGPRRRPPAKEERVKPGATEKRELKKKLEKAKKAKGRAVGDGEEVEEPDGAGDESSDGSIEEVPARETGTVLAGAEALRTRRGKDVLATTADARQGTKGSSTKSLSGQLVAQAMAVASHRKKVKAKNKKPKRDKRKQVVDALVKILTPSSSTATEKKKKKKKKGQRKRKTLADGTIVSCSSDFSSSAEEESADKASSEEQLEQGSLTELREGGNMVTGGIKVATYFAQLRELREMHSLAATLDLLRGLWRSNIRTDRRRASWNYIQWRTRAQAQQPLATRKHGRLVDKVQGKDRGSWGGWFPSNRGRGKGGWKGQGEGGFGQRSEKRKSKDRGKKSKGKGAQWDNKVSEWANSKESTAATLDWGDILKLCADLNKSGCALAWCLFNAEELYHQYGNSTFKRCFFVMDMELKAGRRRSAFPFCEGDFAATKEVCQKTSLAESVTDTFCLSWRRRAWVVLACCTCNSLWSRPQPFCSGGWCKEAKRMVLAVETSVGRMESHGLAEHIDFEGLEKDVGQKLPKLQGRIHIEKGDDNAIAAELVARGICVWKSLEEVVTYEGEKVLNGLFGVPKPSFTDDGALSRAAYQTGTGHNLAVREKSDGKALVAGRW
ncbi:unnamed protein product, partial [Cladocopium goreaui]